MGKIIDFIIRILRALFGLKSVTPVKKENPYTVKKFFFSMPENNFYQVLRSVVGDSYVIFSKVRLPDVFDIASGQGWQAAFNRINRKHVDFLLCSRDYFNPLLAIELDDSSHKKQSRQMRDDFVNEVCSSSGLPLLHIPVQKAYNVSELKDAIQKAIQSK